MFVFKTFLSFLLGAAFATIVQVGILQDGYSKHIPLSWIVLFIVSALVIFKMLTCTYS